MIMFFLSVILFFIVPSNILLFLLIRLGIRSNNVSSRILFLSSYGIAPFLNSVFFYYLIWFFPEKSNAFYFYFIVFFWITMLFLSCFWLKRNLLLYRKMHKDAVDFFKRLMKSKQGVWILFFGVFFSIYIIQSLYYPIIGNDNALYIGQSISLQEYKNIDWENKLFVMVDNSEYWHNSSIRPGIPFLISLFLMGNMDYKLLFQFISSYYYILLFAVYIFLAYELAIELKKDVRWVSISAILFFLFSWTITRSFIFNAKEMVVYFFALLAIYLTYKLLEIKKRDKFVELLLGIVIGIGVFVNLHGLIIGIIVIILLFILSEMSFKDRILQSVSIFIIHLFFSAFDFLKIFRFVFVITFKSLVMEIANKIELLFNWQNEVDISAGTNSGANSQAKMVVDSGIRSATNPKILGDTNEKHLSLYGMKNIWDIYIKGKLQIFTNIGVFGFYFWFFIAVLISNTKEIIGVKIVRIFLLFIFMYFLFVIDIFNFNNHPAAIVLWGSTKYASLLLLFSMLVASAYTKQLFNLLMSFIEGNYKKVASILFIFTLVIIFMKKFILAIGVEVLSLTISFYKEEYFYREKIENFYYIVLILLIFFLFAILLINYKRTFSRIIIMFSLISFFVLTPFFISNVGKVGLVETFKYLKSDLQIKLEKSCFGDIYKVYFFAKNHLDKNTVIKTSLNDVYIYNDYFSLRRRNEDGVKYELGMGCKSLSQIVYNSGDIYLCKR